MAKAFYHAKKGGMQTKMTELFFSRIFHLPFSEQSWPQVSKTLESLNMGKRAIVYLSEMYHSYAVER